MNRGPTVSNPKNGARVGRLRRIRWWGWTILALVILIAAAGGFVWIEHARSVQMAAVSPEQGARLASASVKISCSLPGYVPGRGTVTVTVDGKALDASSLALRTDGAEATVSLADGTHTAAVEYTSADIFSRRLSRSWSFSIDTTSPEVRVVSPSPLAILSQKSNHFVATFSEDATATLSVDGKNVALTLGDSSASSTTSAAGAVSATGDSSVNAGRTVEGDLSLTEGKHEFTLTVTDPLGNRTVQEWEAWADYTAPTVQEAEWPGDTWKQTSAALTFAIADNFPDKLVMSASVDGQNTSVLRTSAVASGAISSAATGKPAAKTSTAKKSTSTTASTGTSPGTSTIAAAQPRYYLLATGELSEGTHDVSVSVQDLGGHVSTWHRTFLVDSTDVFGARPLSEGATGKDVVELQRVLTAKGLYTGEANGVYDSATAQAMAAFNQSRNLTGGTSANADALALMIGSIRIDISERKLYLFSDGKLAKTYSVAIGQPAYPTPVGNWKIISKVRNPIWTPPKSPWAVGLDPVPPGPGNPLGTRWMGLSAPAIGIHGTDADWSIGTAASHGCIRMHIPDAEDLFTRVYIGTPVQIVP